MKQKSPGEHISPAEYKALQSGQKKRRNKFGNTKVKTADGLFDSQAELARWLELKLLKQAGYISDLERQKPFQLSSCKYIADFYYLNLQTGLWVVEDVKGVRTEVYKLKKKMMKAELGIDIVEIKPKALKRARLWHRL